jgi:FkbM family methyltransferase
VNEMVREYKIQSFKGKEFKVVRGIIHPDYSFDTFAKEEHDFRNKYWNIKENDIVFDIGASYGSFSLTACAMGAVVYCFEPEKTVYLDLIENISINNWSSKCFPMNIGMYDEKISVDMKTYAPHWPTWCISGDYSMDTLDNIAEQTIVDKIDWIKIDVEGCEDKVLKGGQKSINKFRPKMIIECHNFLDAELSNKVKALLNNYSFEEIQIEDRPGITLIATPKEVI